MLAALKPLAATEPVVFLAFANLLSRAPLRWIAGRQGDKITHYYALFGGMLARIAPRLAAAFSAMDATPDLYLLSWLLTLFSKPLGLEVSVRLWDRCLLGGFEEVTRCALGLLLHLHDLLLALPFERVLRTLAAVPPPARDEFRISAAIDSVRLTPAEVDALTALERGDLIV